MKSIGIWQASALVVGNIIGSGIAMLPASLAPYGVLGLLGWVITCGGSICLALCFARLSRRFPRTGGPYTYAHEAFGDFVGFQTAWTYWISCWVGNAAIVTTFIGSLAHFWPSLNEVGPLKLIVALAAVWFFTGLNIVSLKATGSVQVLVSIIKIVPLLMVGVVGIAFIRVENFTLGPQLSFSWFEVIVASTMLTLYAFLGLESATIPADDVVKPEKTIPRATIAGTLFAAIVYIWITIVLFGVMPTSQLASSSAPFADAADAMFGGPLAWIVAVCGLLSAFGTLNGWMLLQGQLPLAAARDGLFPSAFARVSGFGTPAFSFVFSSVLLSGVLYLNYGANLVEQFRSIVTLTTFTSVFAYLVAPLADLKYLLIDKQKIPKARLIRAILTSFFAFIYSVIAIYGAGKDAFWFCVAFMLMGIPAYAFMKRKKFVIPA